MDYKMMNLTEKEAARIGGQILEIVPHEVDREDEEFVLKVENDAGEIVGGCIVELYEYGWLRLYLDTLWVDEHYRHHGIGSLIIRELERIARQKGCRVVTLGTASYMARPFYEKHGYTVFTTLKMPNGYLSYSLVKYLERETPEYLPSDNSCARFRITLGNEDDAERIHDGIVAYSEAHEGKFERVDFRKKLADRDGSFAGGVIAEVDKDAYGFVDAVFVEEPLRRQGLGTYLLKEAEAFARENGASMVLTNAGDWNVAFFQKNGYLIRGELRDVPKGHDCYELYKMIGSVGE